jgi:hypothetical protein
MTTHRGDRTWGGNWRSKIKSRLHAVGCEPVSDFLARFPAEPYITVAERLGDDVAAFQLEWMQFEEGKSENAIRNLAMDSLAGDLRSHLPAGWRHGAKADFDTAGAYADWVVRLEQQQAEAKVKATAVWETLEELHPPVGWSPSVPRDPLIVDAFTKGWPESGEPWGATIAGSNGKRQS